MALRTLALATLLVASALASQPTTCQRATNNTDYNPHEPPSDGSTASSWFEGWYLRVSADDGSGASFGIGIGHFPGQAGRLSSPAAACFILVSSGPGSGPGPAGEQVRLYTRNFDALHIASPAAATAAAPPAGKLPAGRAAAAAGIDGIDDTDGEDCARAAVEEQEQELELGLEGAAAAAAAGRDRLGEDVGDGQVSFEVLTGPASSGGGSGSGSVSGSGKGGSAPGADGGGDFCSWRVTSEGVAVAAQLQGTRLQLASPPGACAAAEPWRGPGGCQSPEGWVSKIGFLLRLRYDVLTLRTSVRYSLSEAGDGDGDGSGGGEGPNGGGKAAAVAAAEEERGATAGIAAAVVAGEEAEGHAEAAQGGAQDQAALVEGKALPLSGLAGVDAGVEGASDRASARDGDGEGPALGGVRQRRRRRALQLDGLGHVHMEKNWGQSFPDQWVWAQGHGSAAGRQTSFVMAGGLLPHVLSPALPTVRQYVLAYHPPPPAPPFAVDPWDPPLYSSLVVRGCDGAFALELHTPLHVVHLVASAAPDSFQALPCPTSAGFKNYSVESFTARVQLRVLARPFPFAPPGIARLLHDDTFTAAAMEFGGAYVCPEAMPQTAGVLSEDLVRARAGRVRGGGAGGGGGGGGGGGEGEHAGERDVVRQDWSPWRAVWSRA